MSIRTNLSNCGSLWLFYCLLTVAVSLESWADTSRVLYRYVNHEGIKVINHTVPPDIVEKGYEVITPMGKVIDVVEPAPSKEEIAELKRKQKILDEYKILRKRYSSVEDIQGARDRKLSNIEDSIAVLNGNITSLESSIEKLMARAAKIERAGRTVPPQILEDLSGARKELQVANEQLQLRKEEKQEMRERYQQDILTFEQGKSLQESSRSGSLNHQASN